MIKKRKNHSYIVMLLIMFLSALALLADTAGTIEAASKVTVKKVASVSSLTGKKTIRLAKGKKATLKTTVTATPNKKANKKVTYKSSNPKVASVTGKGVITGKKAGTAKITVRSAKNKKIKAVVTVKVVKGRVTGLKLNKASTTLTKGQTVKLKATVKASKGGSKDVVWSTSNKKVATVNSKGTVKAVGTGNATITVKAADGTGKKASCKVKVKNTSGDIAFAKDTISTLYTSCDRRIRVVCSSAKHGKITWKSSNPEVVSFSLDAGQNELEGESVLISGDQAGTSVITATMDGKSVSHKITVKDFTIQYSYEINFLNQPYSGAFNMIYVKTDNPYLHNASLSFYDTATGQENEPMVYMASFEYADLKKMGAMTPGFLYKTDGGYLGVFCFATPGKTKITVQEMAHDANGNKIYTDPDGEEWMPITANADLGYIDIKDLGREQKAWMQSVIDQVTPKYTAKKDKMKQIEGYMREHSVYPKLAADTKEYVNIAAESGIPFWKFEKYEFDSYTSPAMLTAFGEMIGYPLENLYGKYKRGTPEWDTWHMVARSVEDGTDYKFCPPLDSNLIDTSKVAQIDLSRWHFYKAYK